ncbi:MAG: methyltransferase domain-containing protein [Anaerolineales bacterium]|nr:methyltransferase domain-containing protein [Anaerolineales bacterium]
MFKKLWWGLVTFGFRLLYNEMAWTYDLVSWLVSLGEWRHWQRAALPFLLAAPPGRLLEIAHGPGHMLLALASSGRELHGCDLSPAMGRQARRRLQAAKQPARLSRCYVQDLPYAAAGFSGILSTFPTNYIIDPATLQELHRVLMPGGRVVIVPEGHLTGRASIHRFIAWLFRITGQQSAQQAELARYWQAYSQPAVAAGFQISWHEVKRPHSSCTVLLLEKG